MTVRVGVREFRENLSNWLDRAAGGEEVIVTERGAAKVKVSAIGAEGVLERLIRQRERQPHRLARVGDSIP